MSTDDGEAWKKQQESNIYDFKQDLEEILTKLPSLYDQAKDRAIDDIAHDKKNALFFQYYQRLHFNHEVRNWLRYMLSQTYKEDNFIYKMTENKKGGRK